MRTRTSLLASLVDEVRKKSVDFLGSYNLSMDMNGNSTTNGSANAATSSASAGSRFMETVRKALGTSKSSSTSSANNIKSEATSSCSSTPAMSNGHHHHNPLVHHGSIGSAVASSNGIIMNGLGHSMNGSSYSSNNSSCNNSIKIRHSSRNGSMLNSPVVDGSSSSSTLQVNIYKLL